MCSDRIVNYWFDHRDKLYHFKPVNSSDGLETFSNCDGFGNTLRRYIKAGFRCCHLNDITKQTWFQLEFPF